MQISAPAAADSTQQILIKAAIVGCVGGVLFSVFVPLLFLGGIFGVLGFWVASTAMIAAERPRLRLIIPAIPNLVAAAVANAIFVATGFFSTTDLPPWSLGGYMAVTGLMVSLVTSLVCVGLK